MNLLEQLTAAGGIGSGELVSRSVTWDGHEIPFMVRDLPGGKVQALLKGDDIDPKICVAAICNEDGSPAFTAETILGVKLGLRALMVKEVMDVFGFSEQARADAKKNSDRTRLRSVGTT